MRNLLLYCLLLFGLTACNKTSSEPGDFTILKKECYSAKDERCYLEMTEYMVLKDEERLKKMKANGSIVKLRADKKVKVIKRKIDMTMIEFSGRKGKTKGWVSTKFLK